MYGGGDGGVVWGLDERPSSQNRRRCWPPDLFGHRVAVSSAPSAIQRERSSDVMCVRSEYGN